MRSAWLQGEEALGVAGSRVDVVKWQEGKLPGLESPRRESKLDLKKRGQEMVFFYLEKWQMVAYSSL